MIKKTVVYVAGVFAGAVIQGAGIAFGFVAASVVLALVANHFNVFHWDGVGK